MSGFVHTARLTGERLEAREVPVTFVVALRSVVTGEAGTSAAPTPAIWT